MDRRILAIQKAANTVFFAGSQEFFPCVFIGCERFVPRGDIVVLADNFQGPVLLGARGPIDVNKDSDTLVFKLA